MANLKKDSKADTMGLHSEALKGRTQQVFFDSEAAENFYKKACFVLDNDYHHLLLMIIVII